MAAAGVTASLAIVTVVVASYIGGDLPVWLRVLLLTPLALLPAALIQAVHGLTDTLRLLGWARHFANQAEDTKTTTNKTRSNK